MTKRLKRIFITLQIVIAALVGGLTLTVISNNGYKTQINNQNVIIERYEGILADVLGEDSEYETVFLTVIELDGSEKEIKVYVDLNLTIRDVLLLNGYTQDDFTSYDGINYYFVNSMTDVPELEDNSDYYESSEWEGVVYRNLVVGINFILMDQNYTVIRTGY